MLKIFLLGLLICAPAAAHVWIDPAYQPSDPILCLHYSQAQVSFEKAPPSFIAACAAQPSPYQAAWIFAETTRQEGTYLLTTGLYWVEPDLPGGGPHTPILQDDAAGGIDLIHRDGACEEMWSPDNAFNNYFPDTPDDKPTPAEAAITHDLGIDLIRRAERAFGGKQQLLTALAATNHPEEQDPVMQPLLSQLLKQKN